MAPQTTQTPTRSKSRFIRKPGVNADVSITTGGIKRNEVREDTMVWPDGSTLPILNNIFDLNTYDFVSHILYGMGSASRNQFLATKWFEVIIDQSSLDSTALGVSVLDQLAHLTPVFSQIQKLIIRIAVPLDPIPKAQYKASRTRAFLSSFVGELRWFQCMRQMYVVLELPEGSDNTDDRHLAAYVLPFYELDTFTQWKLQVQENGLFPSFASKACIRHMDQAYREFVEEEEKDIEKEIKQQEDDKSRTIVKLSANPIPINFPRKIFKRSAATESAESAEASKWP